MKITKLFLLLAVMAVAVSCSKDDDPNPQVENAKLSFAGQTDIVPVPSGIANSDDPMANTVAASLEMLNSMTTNFSYFTPPAGAQKSNDLITVSSGRTAARKGVVWYWSNTSGGQYVGVAYQVVEEDDKYTFEIFMNFEEQAEWSRFVYAEERKDRSAGYFALFFGDGEEQMRWAWTRKGDDVTFKVTQMGELKLDIQANNKTKAGSLVTYEGGIKYYEITWDGTGSGTWAQYDDTGSVVEEGFWEA